jgi:hypothetical protein
MQFMRVHDLVAYLWSLMFQWKLRGVRMLPKKRCNFITKFIIPIGNRVMKCDIFHPCSYWFISSNMFPL